MSPMIMLQIFGKKAMKNSKGIGLHKVAIVSGVGHW